MATLGQELLHTLFHALSPVLDVRKNAEEHMGRLGANPGSISILESAHVLGCQRRNRNPLQSVE